MRTINANALTYVAKQYGSEPANIIEFVFGTYADKDTAHVSGKILSLSTLDAIINISSSSDSQEISVTLDDTDGTIKTYMNTNDIHLSDVTVYQWFDGLDFDDKFILFQGQVNSPIVWDEGQRSVQITILSKIEDVEVGFSPEEGQFTKLGNDYAGKAWPMCFGTVNAVKALRLNNRFSGVTAEGFGFTDLHLKSRASLLGAQHYHFTRLPSGIVRPRPVSRTASAASQANCVLAQQKSTERNNVNVFNGEKFPRGDIVLDFGKVQMKGSFTGHLFNFIDSRGGYSTISEDDSGCGGLGSFTGAAGPLFSGRFMYPTNASTPQPVVPLCTGKEGVHQKWTQITYGSVDGFGGYSLWYPDGPITGENCGYTYINPGSSVKLFSDEKIYYAVSCVPGTIKQVSSFINAKGEEFLQNVPSDLWSQENWDLGNGITGVVLVIHDALSKQINPDTGNSWSDELYVTFESDVGPNTADILYYLTTTYANKGIVDYAATRAKIANYPSDFAMYDRPNIVEALKDIAWQARCSIHFKNGAFYLNYLPDDQVSRDTITTSDILENTLTIEYTETEDIVTKMSCLWAESSIQDEDNVVILRNNISKYGTKKEDFDFYIYNYIDAVLKSGTYWLMKYSNTWKRVRFETPITKLALETLDYITLNLSDLASSSVLCSIEEVEYNSDNHSLVFTCFAPVKAGKMVEYPYAYPANLSVSLTYPSEDEFDVWQSSEAINKLTSGNLAITSIAYFGNRFNRANPYPYRNYSGTTQFTSNGYSYLDRRVSDRGTRYISDLGDSYPGSVRLKSTPSLLSPSPGPDSDNTAAEALSGERLCG